MPDQGTGRDVRKAVKEFLGRFVDDPDIFEERPIITAGLLDSLVATQMIDFIEQHCGAPVLDEDLELENFDTLDAIEEFVRRKRATA
ncbi:acyl carrier protein [Streptomyces varsoviensis]|uniref:acyl carrier protein n=1 Tax=Streptomyces varsoviensis TaxID=67373 RepID=UPI0034062D03